MTSDLTLEQVIHWLEKEANEAERLGNFGRWQVYDKILSYLDDLARKS